MVEGPLAEVPDTGTSDRSEPAAGVSLRTLVREDWEAHRRDLFHPGFHALALHRVAQWRHTQPAPLRKALGLLYRLANKLLIRNVYGLEIYESTVVGRRVTIGHHMGVVLGKRAVIGDECLIRQHVTLGLVGEGTSAQPSLGRGVHLGAGATVMGGVTIGDGARIGPNAVVMADVPPGASVFAPPARTMRAARPEAGPAPA